MQTILFQHSSLCLCFSSGRQKRAFFFFIHVYKINHPAKHALTRETHSHKSLDRVCVFVGGTSNKKFERSYSRSHTCTFLYRPTDRPTNRVVAHFLHTHTHVRSHRTPDTSDRRDPHTISTRAIRTNKREYQPMHIQLLAEPCACILRT